MQKIMALIIIINTTLAYVSYIPQIWRILKRKSSEDISLGSWALWLSASTLDSVYSVMLGDIGLIVYSMTELVLNLVVLVLTIIYRERKK